MVSVVVVVVVQWSAVTSALQPGGWGGGVGVGGASPPSRQLTG